MEDIFINIVAITVLILPVFSVLAAWRLWSLSRRHPEIGVLRDQARTAVLLSVGSVLVGMLGFNRAVEVLTGDRFFDRLVSFLILVPVMVLISVPNLLWVLKYRLRDD